MSEINEDEPLWPGHEPYHLLVKVMLKNALKNRNKHEPKINSSSFFNLENFIIVLFVTTFSTILSFFLLQPLQSKTAILTNEKGEKIYQLIYNKSLDK